MLLNTVIVIVVVIAALLAYAATRPGHFRVERSALIMAPADRIFPHIDDFRQWAAWSPWDSMDPDMKRSYEGPTHGKGTVYGWTGNSKVGTGRMEITESTPSSRIVIKLDFYKPMEGHHTAQFDLQSEGNGTRVTWTMHGANPYMAKLFQIFFSMDRLVGGQFSSGLERLKAAAEA